MLKLPSKPAYGSLFSAGPSFLLSTLLWGLIFLSGLAALVYEILWLKQLKITLGSTVYASSIVLATFFLGLSAGSSFWGKRAASFKNPLAAFAALEAGAAISSLLYFVIPPLYWDFHSNLIYIIGENPVLLTLIKIGLSVAIVLPPAFFMGGALPLIIQGWIRDPNSLGRRGSLVYAINTAGAALGAFLAGFHLPMLFGYRNTFVLAVGIKLFIALVAWLISRSQLFARPPASVPADASPAAAKGSLIATRPWLVLVAFLSGYLTLALEVLWTHMYAQVLQNSVYTFSLVLVTFLVALTLGSVLSNGLSRIKVSPGSMICLILSISGILAALSPRVFDRLTNGIQYLPVGAGWNAYVLSVFKNVGIAVGIPVLFMGTAFPYLLKISETIRTKTSRGPGPAPSAGLIAGQLLAFNTVGAILGSLFAGFLLLSAFGLWGSIRFAACAYLLTAIVFRDSDCPTGLWARLPAVIGFAVLLWVPLQPSFYQPGGTAQDHVVEKWESHYGMTAVIKQNGKLRLRSNHSFILGSDRYRDKSNTMADLPLLLHPNPARVYFLGMGTGITAGSALDHSGIKHMVVSELVPEVVTAAKKYFSRNHNLFTDPRVNVVIEDGRYYLAAHPDRYDVIISDLFFPWHEGAGSLWTKDHFKDVYEHLEEDGLFAQWLPLYQLSAIEFSIIARTLTEVFDQVTWWRRDANPETPLGVLIARKSKTPLDAPAFIERVRNFSEHIPFPERELSVFPFLHYAGNISDAAEVVLRASPVNTDDRPWIEFLAPLSYARASTGSLAWFNGMEAANYSQTLLRALPPEKDPYLARLSQRQRDAIWAGLDFYKGCAYRAGQMEDEATDFTNAFCERLELSPCKEFELALRQK